MTGMAVMTVMEARRRAQQEFRRVLQTNLVECRGNVAEMARRMGKDRSTIRYHLCRFGMLGENVGTSARREWDVAFEEPD
jgi:transcriptional regulator with GAF, ATPase, and Fis domain